MFSGCELLVTSLAVEILDGFVFAMLLITHQSADLLVGNPKIWIEWIRTEVTLSDYPFLSTGAALI